MTAISPETSRETVVFYGSFRGNFLPLKDFSLSTVIQAEWRLEIGDFELSVFNLQSPIPNL
jgi:hypothetical protein